MARSYAQFSTAMWRDPDFLALPSAQQRVYMMLSSQQDVSAVGVLHLSITRWAGRAPDTTPGDIVLALKGLAEARFIVFDRDSEEVLLRSFLKWDNGYRNPKRLPAIKDAANEVESRAIVAALAVEFDKLAVAAVFRGQCADVATVPREPPRDSTGVGEYAQVDRLSIGYPGSQDWVSPSERRVPQPPTPNPQPVPPSADSATAPSEQTTLDGMPEPPTPSETTEQAGWRLARAWEKRRAEANVPIIARGNKKRPDQVLMPLKNLIRGALDAKYTEDEINEALRRCNDGIPHATKFDARLGDIREEAQRGAVNLNDQGRAGSDLARRVTPPPARRSTSALRAEQGLAVADELDRKFGHGKYAKEGTQ
jgi:hypothetical protein